MADLTLSQRFGNSVSFNPTSKILSLNLNDLSSIIVNGVDVISISTFNIRAKIFDFNVRTDFFGVDVTLEYQNGNRETVTYGFIGSGYDRRYPGQQKKANTGRLRYGENCTGFGFGSRANNITQLRIERVDGEDDNCGDCTLTIKKDEEIVHQEIRDTCPEVEQLPCRLSDKTKEIKIKKEAWLQRIEVRNQSIDLIFVSPLEAPLLDVSLLPENCLNIYNTYTLAPPFLSNFVPLPGAINPYQFIAQICSGSDCPPPEYEVICDCNDCRECPPGTCVVACGDRVCCYDTSTGKAIESIPVSDYCEGVK